MARFNARPIDVEA